jgi:uncharacterized protein
VKPPKEKEIAVVGVSHKEDKYGYRIFRDLLRAGYKVQGINPSNGEVLGRKISRKLSDLEKVPDLVITVVPPAVTERVVEDCRSLGIPEIWMQPGSESGAAIEKACQYGLETTHQSCFMVVQGLW